MTTYLTNRILIASDSPLEALSLEGLLGSGGYQYVRTTSDAREIKRLYAKWPFDLLILDLNMSSQASTKVLHDLAAAIKSQRLAVLALSDQDDKPRQEEALREGVADIFTRPFARAEALPRVARALDILPKAQTGWVHSAPG